jgi:hypothetical protein
VVAGLEPDHRLDCLLRRSDATNSFSLGLADL